MRVMAQMAMVMNLDKCIGCHTCSVTCKQAWTNRAGTEYVWFNNVETRPGLGYPRGYEDQDQWQGVNVADLLGVPKPDWTAIIPQAIKHISAAVDWVGDNTFVAARLLRYVSKDIVEGMLLVERGGQRTPFFIPDHLQDLWRLKPGTRSADRRTASNQKVA